MNAKLSGEGRQNDEGGVSDKQGHAGAPDRVD